jgi:HK97 family phage portal protein
MGLRTQFIQMLGGVSKQTLPAVINDAFAQHRATFAAEQRAYQSSLSELLSTELGTLIRHRGLTRHEQAGYSNHGLVYACMGRRARNLAGLTFRLAKREPDGTPGEPILDHPLLERLANPFPELYSDGMQFVELWWLYVLASGNAYLMFDEKTAAKTRIPLSLTVLGAKHVSPKIDARTWRLLAWELRWGDTPRLVAPDALHQMKFANPDAGPQILGIGPLQAAQMEVDQDFARQRYDTAFFTNGAVLSATLKYDPGTNTRLAASLTPDQLKQAVEIFGDRHTGSPDKMHRVAALNAGWSLEKLGVSQRDMEFIEGRLFSARNIAMIFGVPRALMNDPEHGALSGEQLTAAEKLEARQNTVPDAKRASSFFQRTLVDRFAPGHIGYFDTDEIPALAEDFTEKVDNYVKLVGAQVPPRAAAELVDLGVDPTLLSEEVLVPAILAPLSDVLNPEPPLPRLPPTPPQVPPPDGAPDATPAGRRRLILLPASAVKRNGSAPADRAELRAIRWRAFVATFRPLERRFHRAVRAYVFALRREVLGNLNDVVSRSVADDILRILFDERVADGVLRRLARPFFAEAIRIGADGAAEEVGGDAIGLEAPGVRAFLDAKIVKVVGINDTIRDELRTALREGFDAGENLNGLATRVREVFDTTATRARTISRTEISTSVNGSRFLELAEQGIERHGWMSAHDQFVRESHAAADGEEVPLGEPFPSTGLLYPGDIDGPPEETVNCLPGDQRISGAVLAASKAFYAGPLVEIETRAGHRVTVTVHHPILSPRGFVPAGALREGDDILCEPLDIHGRSAFWDIQDQNGPPTIEQVFQALRAKGTSTTLRPRVGDFYGDARYFKGQIEIVSMVTLPAHEAIDADLMVEREAMAFPQELQQFDLVVPELAVGMSLPFRARSSSSPFPSASHLSPNRSWIHAEATPFESLALRLPTRFPAVFKQTADDDRAIGVIPLRQGQHAHSAVEVSKNAGDIDMHPLPTNVCRLGATADLTPRFPNPTGNRITLDSAQLAANLVRRYPARITTDRIYSLRRREFLGPVYDVHTVQGYFAAGYSATILHRNCRCSSYAVVSN